VFFGGPADREALEVGTMMMDNPNVKLTMKWFIKDNDNNLLAQEQVFNLASGC